MIVERHDLDGTVQRTAMSLEAWDAFCEECPRLQDIGVAFYLLIKAERHKWNGCRRETVIGSLSPAGTRLQSNGKAYRLVG